jgi:predicted lipoprotein with Yx(FWY)xxD motif
MTRSNNEDRARRPGSLSAVLVAVIAGVAVAAFAGLAFAKGSATLRTGANSSLGEKIALNSKGMAVYELKPETAHHLLCTSSSCLKFWPAVKVSKNAKLSAAAGIKGKLGKLHRGSFYQLTLSGHPLYTFVGDTKAGMASGNGVKSFGGTWHVVSLGKDKSSGTTTSTTSTTTTTNPYYPTTTTTTTTTSPPTSTTTTTKPPLWS